jgi:hypothetical protein
MSDTELVVRESRIARRLTRLFKLERAGRFDRWRDATIARLVARRGELVDNLLDLDRLRCSLAPPSSSELERALAELRQEVNQTAAHIHAQVAQISADLRARLSEGPPSGIRGSGNGRLLGKT